MKHLFILLTNLICVMMAARAADHAGDEDNVMEAVLRYEISHNQYGPNPKYASYYFGICGVDTVADPTDDFLKRLGDISPPVDKASKCVGAKDGIRDLKTGALGLYFDIAGEIVFSSDSEAKVKGDIASYDGHRPETESHTYVLRKANGKWNVIEGERNRTGSHSR